MTENKGQIIIYQTENEDIKVDVYFEDETFRMTQSIMAKLFNVQVPAISKHLKIYSKMVNLMKMQLFP